jgi:hypothetical protein
MMAIKAFTRLVTLRMTPIVVTTARSTAIQMMRMMNDIFSTMNIEADAEDATDATDAVLIE